MYTFYDALSTAGGLALFLYGMHCLSSSLEKISGRKLSQILEKLTGSVWKSVLLGAAITALVQSSSATTVIAVGLVNSGIIKLSQAIGIIMGSNVGTTITSHILRLTELEGDSFLLQLFKPSTFAPVFALVGAAMIMFGKKAKIRSTGEMLVSFGVLFMGMLQMESSLNGLKDSPVMSTLFSTLGSNMFLGILAGAAVTAVLQSSSASVGILQALSTTGAISWSAAIPIILGQNIGTTVTSMISCVGASKAAKRTALSHLYFNIIGTVLFTAGVLVLKSTGVFTFWSEAIDKSGIANFHTLFNVVMTLVFIPFTKLLEKLCMLTVPSDGTEVDSDVSALDEHLLVTPSLAIQAAGIINSKIANLTSECVAGALSRLGGDKSVSTDRINELYTAVMRMNEALNAYLLKIAECELSEEEAKAVTGLLTRSDDCHHIAQHAISISDTAGDILAKGKGLTPGGKAELDCLSRAVLDLCISAMRCSSEQNRRAAAEIEPFCAVVGEMTELISSRHTARLKSGECSYEAGSLFVGTLIDVERIAKHCSNIGVSLAVQYRRGTFSEEEFVRRIHRGDTEHFVEHYIDYKNKYYSPLTAE